MGGGVRDHGDERDGGRIGELGDRRERHGEWGRVLAGGGIGGSASGVRAVATERSSAYSGTKLAAAHVAGTGGGGYIATPLG